MTMRKTTRPAATMRPSVLCSWRGGLSEISFLTSKAEASIRSFRLRNPMGNGHNCKLGFSQEPRTMTAPAEMFARRLLKQAEWCERLGSTLYSTLLRHAAEDVRARGVCCAVLHDHHDDPPDSALALRFLGAVHRLVL